MKNNLKKIIFTSAILALSLSACTSIDHQAPILKITMSYIAPLNDLLAPQIPQAVSMVQQQYFADRDLLLTTFPIGTAVRCDTLKTLCKQTLIKASVSLHLLKIDTTGVLLRGSLLSEMGAHHKISAGVGSSQMTFEETLPESIPILEEGRVDSPFTKQLRFNEELIIEGPFASKVMIRVSRENGEF